MLFENQLKYRTKNFVVLVNVDMFVKDVKLTINTPETKFVTL